MTRQLWLLLLLAVAARCLSLFALNLDPYFIWAPRSLTGAGILVRPLWLDLAVPLVFIVTLWSSAFKEPLTLKSLGQAALDAVWLLAFPLLAGLTLFLYVELWLVKPMFNGATLLHWMQFALSFIAINMFLDRLSVQNRWARRGLALLVTAALALTQDVLIGADAAMFLFSILLSSPGIMLGLVVLALRPVYRQSPGRAVASALLVGGITCLLVVAVRSQNLLTAFLPVLALLAGALTMRSAKPWPRLIALGGVVSIGLFLSLLLPRLASPQVSGMWPENHDVADHVEVVGKMTISYDDPRVRDVTVRLAHVLEAANDLSREAFGISPEVRHLTVRGIAPGGFHAEFPDGIVGNLPSERAAKSWLDAAYLNAPEFSIHDLDPVTGILHEYAHLYGTVPYMPWIMGSEEEGWATYAATRLSLLLYEKYGAGLWSPPYDYARRARAITSSNLEGHSVLWSHANEFGGFRLWHALGRRDGEVAVFRRRWELTQRAEARFLLMTNDPAAARHMAAGFGEPAFSQFGRSDPVRFAQAISLESFLHLAKFVDLPADKIRELYARRADATIRPGVVVPRSTAMWDGAIALGVLALGIVLRWWQRPIAA